MAITDEVLNELLKDYQKPEDLLGRDGLLKQLQKRLLEKATVQKPQGDQLRELRSVELLELAATPEARQVLDVLAKGAAGARLTREAKAAADRLAAAK